MTEQVAQIETKNDFRHGQVQNYLQRQDGMRLRIPARKTVLLEQSFIFRNLNLTVIKRFALLFAKGGSDFISFTAELRRRW